MPLARVRTSLSNIPEELKQQLQLAGYEIEIAAPGKKLSRSADLEISIESLPIGEALASAGRANTVYIAPGTLRRAEPVMPVVAVPKGEPVPIKDQQRRETEQQMLAQRRAEQQAAETERLRLEQARVREEKKREGADHQWGAELRTEHQRLEDERNASLKVERERVEAEARKQQRVLQMWREAEARHGQASDPEAIRLREEQRRQEEHKAELRRQAALAEEQRLKELKAEQQRQIQEAEEEHRRWQAEQARLREEQEQLRLELQRKQDEIHAEQQRLRLARERLVRDRLMAEQAAERARQEADISVATSTMSVASAPRNVVPINATVSLDSTIVEPTVIRTASGETANLSVTSVSKGAQFIERRRHPRLPLVEGGARRLRHKEYRRAALSAVALTVIVMGLWIALASRQAASPLATNQLVRSAGIEQAAPFGAAKLNAPVQLSHPVAQPTATTKQVATVAQPKTVSSQAAPKKLTAAKPNPKKKSRSVRRAQADPEQEVVVRHFGVKTASTTTKKTASTKDGVKVFSDMD